MKPILAATLVVAAVAPVASAAPDPAIAWSTPIGVDTTTHGRGTFVSSIRNGVALFSGTATQSAAAHVAVDTATGTVRWTQLMERSGSALLAPDGSAYVNGYEFDRGDLLTRIGSDGARQWTITSPYEVTLVPRVADDAGVYAIDYPREAPRVFRIAADDGHVAWSVGLAELGARSGSLVDIGTVDGDLLAFHTRNDAPYDTFVSRFAQADGALVWRASLAPAGDPIRYATQAFRVSPDGATLYWLGASSNAEGGQSCWISHYSLANGLRLTSVALPEPLDAACGSLGSNSPGNAAFAADGDLLVSVPAPSGISASIRRLDGATGTQRWATTTDVAGRIVVGDDGRVLATALNYDNNFNVVGATASLLAPDTGAVLNRFTMPSPGILGSISIAADFLPGNSVWVAANGSTPTHQSRRAADGTAIWSRDMSPTILAPMDGYAVMSGAAHAMLVGWLVDSLDGNVLRLPLVAMQRIDRETGGIDWRVVEEGPYANTRVGFREHASGDTIETTSFFSGAASDRSRIFRFDQVSGVPSWTTSSTQPVAYFGAEPVGNDTIVAFGTSNPYASSPSWILQGLDATSGAPIWSRSRPVGQMQLWTFARDGMAFAQELASSPVVSAIERLDPATGATLWRHEYDAASASTAVPVQAAAGGDVFVAHSRNSGGGRTEVVVQRLARDTGALQWTVVVAPSTAYSEDTPVLRVANDVVDVVTRRRRAGDESSAITRLAQADGALAWSRELPKLAAGTELAQQMRVMPDGTLAIVRSVGLRDRGQRWLRGSLLDRVDATTGAFVSSHLLSLATDEHSRDVGAYPPSWIVGQVDADDFLAYDYGVTNDNGRTQRMSRFNVPATFATGDAHTTIAMSAFADDGRMRGYDFDVATTYAGDALPAPITLHLDAGRAVASIAWTCSVSGGGGCSPATGTGAARIAVSLAPGATASVHGTLRTPLGGALVATVRAYAALPFAAGETTPGDNAASTGVRLELFGNSFE